MVSEHAGGSRFGESNLQALCEICHRAKTSRENSVPPSKDQADWQRFLQRGDMSFLRHGQIYQSDGRQGGLPSA